MDARAAHRQHALHPERRLLEAGQGQRDQLDRAERRRSARRAALHHQAERVCHQSGLVPALLDPSQGRQHVCRFVHPQGRVHQPAQLDQQPHVAGSELHGGRGHQLLLRIRARLHRSHPVAHRHERQQRALLRSAGRTDGESELEFERCLRALRQPVSVSQLSEPPAAVVRGRWHGRPLRHVVDVVFARRRSGRGSCRLLRVRSGGQAVADALWGASDHLPVVTVLRLASRVVAASRLGFGSVIVGGSAQQTLNVSDGGTPPVDALDYSFASVPAGLTAPAGSFSVANGSVNPHVLGMDSSAPGVRAGALTMSTDDPDSTSKPVQLSGTVLDHAQPSLDSLTVKTADAIDWGTRPGGAFGDTTIAVFDQGYGPLRARLSIGGATINGGSGRFSLVGASFPALIAGTGDRFTVHFEDGGASPDTVYQATLTFATADEALPGATSLAPLALTLSAHRSEVTGVGDVPVRALAFLAPRPNPLSAGCTVGFDLPRPADAELAIFDLGGRRVATLSSGPQDAGRHLLRWDAKDASGTRVGAGIYLARFHTPGLDRTARIVVLR
ncbi:MAG: hypothetical protein E6K80_02525 [Candidatus Eisenbacteria bacterium]|uniref:FlgD/Vpr Ig-like domain-containing protein n=1 Tax=Eiseniibacteriota bacterium TaxID=2212470 RepID=A0A538U9L7_UNCEI|nr:MAG: hypothetical protein E6K80_02525 [Candidatus Eisenbacteria bacterium]